MEESKYIGTIINKEYLRIVPRMSYYLKSKNIAGIFKYKCLLFAAGGYNGEIELFSNSLEYMGSLCGHKEPILCLCAFPNKILASGSYDKNIKIWDTEKRRLISTLYGHTGWVCELCYVREGVIVSGSNDKSLIIWSKSTPESSTYSPRQRLKGHTSIIKGIVRMSNTEIMSGDNCGNLKIWDIDQGLCTKHIPSEGLDSSYQISQMKKSKWDDVVVSHPNIVKKWGAFNEWVGSHKQFGGLCDGGPIEFLSEGNLLLRGGNKGELEFINFRGRYEGTPPTIKRLDSADILDIKRIAKNIVVTVSMDGYLKVIDPISIPRTCYMKFKKSFGWKKAIAYFY